MRSECAFAHCRAEHRHRFPPQRRVLAPPRGPVDGVLQHTGDGVQVLRRHNEQSVSRADPLLQVAGCGRKVRDLYIRVEQRDVGQLVDVQPHPFGRLLLSRPQRAVLKELRRRLPGMPRMVSCSFMSYNPTAYRRAMICTCTYSTGGSATTITRQAGRFLASGKWASHCRSKYG